MAVMFVWVCVANSLDPEAAPPLAASVLCAAAFIKQSQGVYTNAVRGVHIHKYV